MPPADADFSFTIKFARGRGDPRRVFDAASRLIDGFEELDAAFTGSIDAQIKTAMVLEDIDSGSIKVWLRSILENIDDKGLREGEFKKAIGPALVKAKYAALEYLNQDKEQALGGVDRLREELRELAADTDIKHLPDYAPIHEGRLVASLDKIQDAKKVLGPKDRLSIEADGKVYEVDLTKTWQPADVIPVPDTTERHSEGVLILTIRKPDLLGGSRWLFSHGKIPLYATMKDERWLKRLHDGKIPLHSGDALRCKVRFTYVFDKAGTMIEQRTDIIKVLRIIKGSGPQIPLFDDDE